MRPGPGLVVMALAFISGARRGSTSSISSKTTTTTTTTTTSSPPPPPPTTQQQLNLATPSLKFSYLESFQTTLIPSSTSSSASIRTSKPSTGSTSSASAETHKTIPENLDFSNSKTFTEQPDGPHLGKRPKETVTFNIFNTFLTRDIYSSYPLSSSFFTYTYPLPSYLLDPSDESRARAKPLSVLRSAKQTRRANINFRRRRKRRTRSATVNYRGSGTDIDDATENLNDSDDTPTLLTTAIDSSSDRSTLARGLPVHFPSHTAADSSKSLDEDDIFALVAEDDLLSEESFDHLVKLTNDKIGDTNEEDYSSGTETIVESSSGSGNGALEDVHETTDQQNTVDEFLSKQQLLPETTIQQQQNENPNILQNDDNDDSETVDVSDGDKANANANHNSEQNIVDTVYNAHLVSNANKEVVLLNEADTVDVINRPDTATKESRQLDTATSLTHIKKAELDKYQTILESNFALTRLNPWISACDLAQPGPLAAPDLQVCPHIYKV